MEAQLRRHGIKRVVARDENCPVLGDKEYEAVSVPSNKALPERVIDQLMYIQQAFTTKSGKLCLPPNLAKLFSKRRITDPEADDLLRQDLVDLSNTINSPRYAKWILSQQRDFDSLLVDPAKKTEIADVGNNLKPKRGARFVPEALPLILVPENAGVEMPVVPVGELANKTKVTEAPATSVAMQSAAVPVAPVKAEAVEAEAVEGPTQTVEETVEDSRVQREETREAEAAAAREAAAAQAAEEAAAAQAAEEAAKQTAALRIQSLARGRAARNAAAAAREAKEKAERDRTKEAEEQARQAEAVAEAEAERARKAKADAEAAAKAEEEAEAAAAKAAEEKRKQEAQTVRDKLTDQVNSSARAILREFIKVVVSAYYWVKPDVQAKLDSFLKSLLEARQTYAEGTEKQTPALTQGQIRTSFRETRKAANKTGGASQALGSSRDELNPDRLSKWLKKEAKKIPQSYEYIGTGIGDDENILPLKEPAQAMYDDLMKNVFATTIQGYVYNEKGCGLDADQLSMVGPTRRDSLKDLLVIGQAQDKMWDSVHAFVRALAKRTADISNMSNDEALDLGIAGGERPRALCTATTTGQMKALDVYWNPSLSSAAKRKLDDWQLLKVTSKVPASASNYRGRTCLEADVEGKVTVEHLFGGLPLLFKIIKNKAYFDYRGVPLPRLGTTVSMNVPKDEVDDYRYVWVPKNEDVVPDRVKPEKYTRIIRQNVDPDSLDIVSATRDLQNRAGKLKKTTRPTVVQKKIESSYLPLVQALIRARKDKRLSLDALAGAKAKVLGKTSAEEVVKVITEAGNGVVTGSSARAVVPRTSTQMERAAEGLSKDKVSALAMDTMVLPVFAATYLSESVKCLELGQDPKNALEATVKNDKLIDGAKQIRGNDRCAYSPSIGWVHTDLLAKNQKRGIGPVQRWWNVFSKGWTRTVKQQKAQEIAAVKRRFMIGR